MISVQSPSTVPCARSQVDHRISRSQPGLICTKSSRQALQPSIQITAESVELLHRDLVEQKDLYLPVLALGHKRITESEGHIPAMPKLVKTVKEDLALIIPPFPNSTTSDSTISPEHCSHCRFLRHILLRSLWPNG